MRVDHGLDAFLLGLVQRDFEHLVARPAHLHRCQVDVLQAVAIGQARLEPVGRIVLARPEHVGQLLLVGGQPQVIESHVTMQHVAGPDQLPPLLVGQGQGAVGFPPGLDVDGRLEPGLQAEIQHLLAHPPHHIVGGRYARLDDPAGERFGNDGMAQLDDAWVDDQFGLDPPFQPTDGQPGGLLDAPGIGLAQGRRDVPVFVMRQSVGKGKHLRDVQPNDLGVPLAHHTGQTLVLVLFVGVPGRLVQIAVSVAVQGQPLKRPILAPAEHQDGTSSRRHGRFRHQRHDDRILVIFARGDDPHVKTLALHHLRQHLCQALLQPGVTYLGPGPQRQDLFPVRIGHDRVSIHDSPTISFCLIIM